MDIYDDSRKDVLEACLWLWKQGYFGALRGTGGNVSVRIGGRDAMAVTPTSIPYASLTPEDICICDLSGVLQEGRQAPSIEAGMHGTIYRTRPDVNAVVHTHQVYGSVFAVLNLPVPALFDEAALLLGESVKVAPYAFSGTPELAANVASCLGGNANACILQNHGVVTLGKTLDKALLAAELLEKVAHVYYMALATGRPVSILPEATLRRVRELQAQETSSDGL